MSETYTYTDPRTLDGDPFEVAASAVLQAIRAVELADLAVADADAMARNAEMERDLLTTGECSAKAWTETAQARIYAQTSEQLSALADRLKIALAAAAYNPRKPPRETS